MLQCSNWCQCLQQMAHVWCSGPLTFGSYCIGWVQMVQCANWCLWLLQAFQFSVFFAVVSLGGEGRKILSVGHYLLSDFHNSSKNNGRAFSGTYAQRLYNSCNHVHVPGLQAADVAESGPKALLQVLQNSRSCMFMLRFETLSAQNHHWQNSRKKKERAQQYKSDRVSALLFLKSTEKNSIWLVMFHNLDLILAFRIVIVWLFKLNIKAGQDIPKFLTSKLLSIHGITLDIDWKNLFFLLAQFWLNAHQAGQWGHHGPHKNNNQELEF